MNLYEVVVEWYFAGVKDEDCSHKGNTVADYKENIEHVIKHPEVYGTQICYCEVIIKGMVIIIRHYEFEPKGFWDNAK